MKNRLNPCSSWHKNRGAVLITSLMLLILLMMMAVSAVNSNTVNLRIVGNTWSQEKAESTAQLGLDTLFQTNTNYDKTKPTWSATIENVDVTIPTPKCINAQKMEGYSATADQQIIPEETDWVLKADASDNVTGAKVTVYEGVNVILTAGACD